MFEPGKTCEQIKGRVNQKLLTSKNEFLRAASSPFFRYISHIGKNLAVGELQQATVNFNKPRFIGASILDLSKLTMYKFWYETLPKCWPDRQYHLCLHDTDSFLIYVETEDAYRDLERIKEKLDTANYPKTALDSLWDPVVALQSDERDRKPLFFKDEAAGQIIESFHGPKPKCYTIQMAKRRGYTNEKPEVILKGKGAPRAALLQQACLADYRDIIRGNLGSYRKELTFYSIISKRHQIFTAFCKKVALSAMDEKRYICSDSINTFAYGNRCLRHVRFRELRDYTQDMLRP